MDKKLHPRLKKGELGIPKNYKGITLSAIADKVEIMLCFLTVSNLKLRKFLGKNQNGFRSRSITSQILTIRQIIEGVGAKNLEVALLFVDFSKAFKFHIEGKLEQMIQAKKLLHL